MDLSPYRTRTGAVVVPAEVAGELLRAVIRDLTVQARRDGMLVSDRARAVLHALHLAAVDHDRACSATGSTGAEPVIIRPQVTAMTIKEAAAELECSPRWVRSLVAAGRLRARRSGRVLLVDAADLDAYRRGQRAA